MTTHISAGSLLPVVRSVEQKPVPTSTLSNQAARRFTHPWLTFCFGSAQEGLPESGTSSPSLAPSNVYCAYKMTTSLFESALEY
jgi:hypothetical protein